MKYKLFQCIGPLVWQLLFCVGLSTIFFSSVYAQEHESPELTKESKNYSDNESNQGRIFTGFLPDFFSEGGASLKLGYYLTDEISLSAAGGSVSSQQSWETLSLVCFYALCHIKKSFQYRTLVNIDYFPWESGIYIAPGIYHESGSALKIQELAGFVPNEGYSLNSIGPIHGISQPPLISYTVNFPAFTSPVVSAGYRKILNNFIIGFQGNFKAKNQASPRIDMTYDVRHLYYQTVFTAEEILLKKQLLESNEKSFRYYNNNRAFSLSFYAGFVY